MDNNYDISTDKSKPDVELITDYLSNVSYWARGRSMETVKRSIENSLCFGVYHENKQVGFARVITDFTIFTWILDVFIIDSYQKRGLGKALMDKIMNHEDLQDLQRWALAKVDAHALYKKFAKPEFVMEIFPKIIDRII